MINKTWNTLERCWSRVLPCWSTGFALRDILTHVDAQPVSWRQTDIAVVRDSWVLLAQHTGGLHYKCWHCIMTAVPRWSLHCLWHKKSAESWLRNDSCKLKEWESKRETTADSLKKRQMGKFLHYRSFGWFIPVLKFRAKFRVTWMFCQLLHPDINKYRKNTQ